MQWATATALVPPQQKMGKNPFEQSGPDEDPYQQNAVLAAFTHAVNQCLDDQGYPPMGSFWILFQNKALNEGSSPCVCEPCSRPTRVLLKQMRTNIVAFAPFADLVGFFMTSVGPLKTSGRRCEVV